MRRCPPLLAGVAPRLLAEPLNVMRLSLHPEGLAGHILNFQEWRAHLLQRLAHEAEVSADAKLLTLLDEMRAYPQPPHRGPDAARHREPTGIAIPFVLASPVGPLSFISTTTVFRTAVEVTLEEVTIEAFLPADAETAKRMLELKAKG